jgi:hypothetical protein
MDESQFQELMKTLRKTNTILEEIISDLKEINRLTKQHANPTRSP